jgi:hypothetical protein
MATTAITLNGVSFTKCVSIDESDALVGVAIQAANGARRFARRARKRQFTLNFDGMTIAQMNTLRAVMAITTSFAFVDGEGVSTTVITQTDPLSIQTPVIDGASNIWYAATLTLYEV